MRCRRARRAIVERRLGRLAVSDLAALETHLAGCEACAGEQALEQRLAADLARLRQPYPLRVEVTARVMGELRAADRGYRLDPQLAWGALAAVLAAALLAVAGAGLLGALPVLFAGGRAVAEAVLATAGDLLGPVLEVVAIPFRVLSALLRSVAPPADSFPRLVPLAHAIGVTLIAVLATASAGIAGRELLRPSHGRERGDR